MSLFEILIIAIVGVGVVFLVLAVSRFGGKDRNVEDSRLEDRDRQILELKAEVVNKDKQLTENIKELLSAKQKFEEEQARVKEHERARQDEVEANRDRLWKEHEDKSLNFMEEVCQKKDIRLNSFSNNKLPSDFPKGIQPDFMVEIMDQYAIFDAKLSKSKKMNDYIKTQVKSTAEKYKKHNKVIFPYVFFVIPTISVSEIKETYLSHESFHFFVITLEAFEPIIRTLKKLMDYNFAKDMDPEDRDKIVNCIALMSRQIKEQNSVNLLGTLHGLKTLNELQNLPADIGEKVAPREANMTFENIKMKEIQDLRDSPAEQKKKLIDFIEPKKPEIAIGDIAKAAKRRRT